jgi:hypothetical protein
MVPFRLRLNRLTVPDEGWGGRLSLLTSQDRRVAATLSLAVRNRAPPPPRAHGDAGPMLGDDHDNFRYRVPRDLAISPTPLRRVLIVGSCMAAPFQGLIHGATPGCPTDYVLFNNLSELPDAPPRPVADYDFQFVQIPLRSVLPDHLYFRTPADPAAWQRVFDEARERLGQFLAAALRWNTAHGLLTFVANFMVPQQNAHGRLLPRYDLSNPVYLIERLNQCLHEELASRENAHVLDLDQIAATFGRNTSRTTACCSSITAHCSAMPMRRTIRPASRRCPRSASTTRCKVPRSCRRPGRNWWRCSAPCGRSMR